MRNRLGAISRIAAIIFGTFLCAVAINELLAPHKLLSGGIGGISLMIQYTTGISAGALILMLNIPIFIIGIREIDRDFIIYSLLGTASLSFLLIFLKNVQILSHLKVDDTMLSCIFGGVLNGLGAGIVFKNRGSMGGSDIIAVIVKKHRSINIGTVILLTNIAIISIASILFGIKPAMFTLVSMYISSVLIDKVQEGFDRTKSVIIISGKEEEVAKAILVNLKRGVTYLYGEGAYTGSKRRIIYCIIMTNQLAKLKHIVESIDSSAFLSVSDTVEVLGKGFRKKRI